MLPPYPSQKVQLRLDLKLLSKFIYELNIARHHTLTYPAGHPVIGQSVHQALAYLEQLQPEKGLLSIGISKNKLVIGQTLLDEKNPVFREFAAHFFGHGIAVVTLHQSLDEEQLQRFLEIVGQSREIVLERGGLLQLMKTAAIDAVQIKPVDYSAFGISEQISAFPLNRTAVKKKGTAIWERFVQQLLSGTATQNQTEHSMAEGFVPQEVAERLNDQAVEDELPLEGQYDQAITEFLRELDREHLSDMGDSLALGRLQGLASQLNPELRAQLLNSTFRAVAPNKKMAEKVLSQFSGTMLMEVLETLNARQATIPPIIFTLMDRLNRCENSQGSASPPASENTVARSASISSEQLLSPLYAQDESESFIPDEYSETLRLIENPGGLKPAAETDAHFWQSFFSQQPLESKVSDIVFELTRTGSGEGKTQAFKETLLRMCGHFLDTGDFGSLAEIYLRLASTTNRGAAKQPVWLQELSAELESGEFISKIFDRLQAWGKGAFREGSHLFQSIGQPVIDPLLDRLAVESNRALRQFYMNCLVDQGMAIKEQSVARLKDDRWYYLRNLIIILRRLEDPASMAAIDPLWHHPHEKVRQEVLKTALVFQDPQGSCHLLEELAQPDHQRRLSAVKMARHCQDPTVRSFLLALFSDRKLSLQGLQLKFAALDSLAEQGQKDLLPYLEDRFCTFSLWHPRRLMRLRQRILRSLHHFSPEDIATLLNRLSSIKRPAVARLVQQARADLLKESP
jgi:hypothetical protein